MSTTSLLNWAQRQSPRELIQFARAGAVDKMTGAECYAVILALASKLEVAKPIQSMCIERRIAPSEALLFRLPQCLRDPTPQMKPPCSWRSSVGAHAFIADNELAERAAERGAP